MHLKRPGLMGATGDGDGLTAGEGEAGAGEGEGVGACLPNFAAPMFWWKHRTNTLQLLSGAHPQRVSSAAQPVGQVIAKDQ